MVVGMSYKKSWDEYRMAEGTNGSNTCCRCYHVGKNKGSGINVQVNAAGLAR